MKCRHLNLEARCKTTAMGIMPHTDVGKALEVTLGLDIPFWPQLLNISFNEDMYAQTSENFPGVVVDLDDKKVSFSANKFEEELSGYSQRMAEPETFVLSQDYPAIQGQISGPVSFGFRVTDENSRPVIYSEGVKALLFDFIQRKNNLQYWQLKEKNQNAFVWLDEPGLG